MSSESSGEKESRLFRMQGRYGNVDLMTPNVASFGLYGEAFWRAGQAVAEKLATAVGYSDLDACPIVFLYRHSIELYLKGIGLIGRDILQLRNIDLPDASRLLNTHILSSLTPYVKRIFDEVEWKWETNIEGLRNFQEFETLIEEIERVDANSFAFRYPVNTKGKSSLPQSFRFNVLDFCNELEPLLLCLDSANVGLKAIRDSEIEAYVEEMRIMQESEPETMIDHPQADEWW
jgi:hypothetical protein